MGFFSGRVTALKYRVIGSAPTIFAEEHLDNLSNNQAGKGKIASPDGIEVGWTAGDHILDTDFTPGKNIINDMLFFGIRIDSDKLPNDLLKAYYHTDLRALSRNNPSGIPSGKQKREAKESARDRLQLEARDGRYKRRKIIEMVWDRLANEIYYGTTALTHADQMVTLFHKTFGLDLEPISAGVKAFMFAEANQRSRNVEDAQPSSFVPGLTPNDIAWILDETSRDYLGNEFILWLWYTVDQIEDTIKVFDQSEISIMLARTLTLECPRGQTGSETIKSEGPTRLPEARRAIQAGKWPRKIGLTLARQDQIYEFTLNAETLAISGAKLPAPTETQEALRLQERADSIRHLLETLDLLFHQFGEIRFSSEWPKELVRMQKWLMREDHRLGASA